MGGSIEGYMDGNKEDCFDGLIDGNKEGLYVGLFESCIIDGIIVWINKGSFVGVIVIVGIIDGSTVALHNGEDGVGFIVRSSLGDTTGIFIRLQVGFIVDVNVENDIGFFVGFNVDESKALLVGGNMIVRITISTIILSNIL